MNFLMDQVGQISGIPQPIPFPETPIVNDYGTKMLNNINISNSTVGVVNTGTIQAVDVAITSLNQEGNSEVAEALRALSQSILDSSELQSAKKKQALELLDAVSAEAVAPATEGRSAVVRPLMVELANVVSGIAALEVLAAKYIPLIISFFGG